MAQGQARLRHGMNHVVPKGRAVTSSPAIHASTALHDYSVVPCRHSTAQLTSLKGQSKTILEKIQIKKKAISEQMELNLKHPVVVLQNYGVSSRE